MTAQEVIKAVEALPEEDWMKIQSGIADLITARFSSGEIIEIRDALAESEAEYARGEGLSSQEVQKQLGFTARTPFGRP